MESDFVAYSGDPMIPVISPDNKPSLLLHTSLVVAIGLLLSLLHSMYVLE